MDFCWVGYICNHVCLAELATAFPVSGSFTTYVTLFVDKSISFAIAWNYALQWLVTFPLQLVAASLAIEYWTIKIHPAIFVTIFYVCIVLSIYLESTAMQKLKW